MRAPILSHSVLQERDQVRARPALIIIVVTIAVGAGAVVLMWLYLRGMEQRLGRAPGEAQAVQMGAHKSGVEQTMVEYNRTAQELEVQQQRQLRSWGWVERDAGIVHIPIERAFDVVLREGRK